MAKAGRKPGFRHSDETRAKIKAAALINRMTQIAMGEVEADPTQVNAAKALLAKVLPDLKSVEMDMRADMVAKVETTLKVVDADRSD